MNRYFTFNLFALALVLALVQGAKKVEAWQNTPAPTFYAATGQNSEGAWEGTLDAGTVKLRLALKAR